MVQGKVNKTDGHIDRLVYQLYELTAEEICVVVLGIMILWAVNTYLPRPLRMVLCIIDPHHAFVVYCHGRWTRTSILFTAHSSLAAAARLTVRTFVSSALRLPSNCSRALRGMGGRLLACALRSG